MGKYLNRWNTTIPKEKVAAYHAYLKKYNKGTGYDDAEDYNLKGAFMSGEKPDKYGHLTDKYKKPNHITFSKDSAKYPGEEGGDWNEKDKSFTPGPSNMRYHSEAEMRDYFKTRETPVTGWKLSQKWRQIKGASR